MTKVTAGLNYFAGLLFLAGGALLAFFRHVERGGEEMTDDRDEEMTDERFPPDRPEYQAEYRGATPIARVREMLEEDIARGLMPVTKERRPDEEKGLTPIPKAPPPPPPKLR